MYCRDLEKKTEINDFIINVSRWNFHCSFAVERFSGKNSFRNIFRDYRFRSKGSSSVKHGFIIYLVIFKQTTQYYKILSAACHTKTIVPPVKRSVSNFKKEIRQNRHKYKLCTNTRKIMRFANNKTKNKTLLILNSHSLIYNAKTHTHIHTATPISQAVKYIHKNTRFKFC